MLQNSIFATITKVPSMCLILDCEIDDVEDVEDNIDNIYNDLSDKRSALTLKRSV